MNAEDRTDLFVASLTEELGRTKSESKRFVKVGSEFKLRKGQSLRPLIEGLMEACVLHYIQF